MNTTPLASIRIRRSRDEITGGTLPVYNRFLYVLAQSGSYETMLYYISNDIAMNSSSNFNPYSFSLAGEAMSEAVREVGFWNSQSDTYKGNPRLVNGIFDVPNGASDKFMAFISGDVGVTASKRELGVCTIAHDGAIADVSENSIVKCADGESIIGASVTFKDNLYNLFIVRKLADNSTRIEHWTTLNISTTPTFNKIIDSSTNHSSNNGSIYAGGFLDVTSFIYDDQFKLMVTGITSSQYAGNMSPSGSDEPITTVGWYNYNGAASSDVNITPDYSPSFVGPIILPFPIIAESFSFSSRKMLGVRGSIIIFAENGKNYIILGYAGYKYLTPTTYDQVKNTIWIYEFNLL